MTSEVFGAVRGSLCAEEVVCSSESACLQLAHATGRSKSAERERAKIHGGEIGDVELELGVRLGALDLTAGDPPAAGVPGAELVAHLEHDLPVTREAAARERLPQVDEPKPQTLCETQVEAARVHDHQEERRRRIESAFDARDQVDAEDEAPELALGDRAGRERLDETHLAVREAMPPLLLDAVERVRSRLPLELEDRRVL